MMGGDSSIGVDPLNQVKEGSDPANGMLGTLLMEIVMVLLSQR